MHETKIKTYTRWHLRILWNFSWQWVKSIGMNEGTGGEGERYAIY